MYKFLFLISLGLGIAPYTACAQVSDTTKVPLLQPVAGIRIGVDAFNLALQTVESDRSFWSVEAEVLLGNRLFLAAEYGQASVQRLGLGYNYESEGQFFRLGLDYNFWYRDKKGLGALFTGGIRYGLASFDQSLFFEGSSTYWESFNGDIQDEGLRAQWVEAVFSLRGRLFNYLYIGPFLSVMAQLQSPQENLVEVNDIPAFGQNQALQIRVGYSVQFLIPFGSAYKK